MTDTTQHLPVYCRLCEARCGLLARVEGGRLTGFSGDADDPVSRGFVCDQPDASLAALTHPDRVRTPLRRGADGTLQPATWDEALQDIGQRMRELRSRHGARALGLFMGRAVQHSSRLLARSLAVGVGLGTPNLLSSLVLGAGPRLQVTEWMLGQPTPLLVDVGRAHYVVLLGQDASETDWGPMHAGQHFLADLRHSRKTKGTKVIVASPRRGPLCDDADQYLPIRPGTELYFLLGLLSATLKGDWIDHQYVRDYSTGLDQVRAAMAPWTVERCAVACGLEPAQISGIALKLTRSAMSVVHPGHGALSGPHAAVAAWAWLTLHTLTANTLRPGGLYAHPGLVDLQLALQGAPSDSAPTTRTGSHPLLLLQAPATVLADEALSPGPEQLRGLISVGGDPVLELPGSDRTRRALDELDLHVVLTTWKGPGCAHADWVLPVRHPWEEDDLQLLDGILLPVTQVAAAPAVVGAPEQARPAQEALREIFSAVHPGARGSAFGMHFSFAARLLAGGDLQAWEQRLLDWLGGVEEGALDAPPHRVDRGDTNRAEWRLSTDDERIHLAPAQVLARLAAVEDPAADPALPLWLRTSARRDRRPDPLHGGGDVGVFVHPDSGVADGATVRVETRYGQVTATAHHDEGLRPDAVDLPWGQAGVDVMAVLPADVRDPLTGAPWVDGLPCRIAEA